MIRRFLHPLARLLHSDRGGASVSFMLCLPIFLWIMAVIVQYALLVNAKVNMNHSAYLAARAAVTSLPEGRPENVTRAARLALASLSPKATDAAAAEAEAVYQSLTNLGVQLQPSFPARYTYAMDATQVSWSPPDINYPGSYGRPIDVTVSYEFRLTVPGTMRIIGHSGTVGGIDGRFFTMTATCRVETSHSRQAGTDGDGLPQ